MPGIEDVLSAVVPALKGFGEILAGAGKIANEAINSLASGITAATGAIMGPFQALAGAVGPFVQALNPALMNAFNYAMESLKATIGVALTPVIQVLIGAVRQVSGILMPAMQALAPAIGSITRALLQALMPAFRVTATFLEGMAPIFKFLADILKEIVSGFNALYVVSQTLMQFFTTWLNGLFGGKDGMKSFLDSFRDAVHKVTEALLQLAAYAAKLFGERGLAFIKAMQENLLAIANGPKRPGAVPAPQQGGFQSFEALSKQMATAAFAAAGRGDELENKDEKQWLRDLAKMLGDIAKDGKTFQQVLGEQVNSIAGGVSVIASNTARGIEDRIGAPHVVSPIIGVAPVALGMMVNGSGR